MECKGRTITIVDASPDTREFQRNVLGMSVPAASLSYPEQPLSKSERARKAAAAVASKIDHSDPDKAAARREKAAIKAKSAHFLKDSGRVLKFKGAWEDGTGTFWRRRKKGRKIGLCDLSSMTYNMTYDIIPHPFNAEIRLLMVRYVSTQPLLTNCVYDENSPLCFIHTQYVLDDQLDISEVRQEVSPNGCAHFPTRTTLALLK